MSKMCLLETSHVECRVSLNWAEWFEMSHCTTYCIEPLQYRYKCLKHTEYEAMFDTEDMLYHRIQVSLMSVSTHLIA